MKPKERLLTTLDHREPDRVPLTARLWLDTRIKLRSYYGVKRDEELYKKLGVEPDRANIGLGPTRGWEPTMEFLEFCEATGYDAIDQHTSYEEWGIKRKLGSKGPGRALRQFYFAYHPWEHFTEVSEVEEVELPDLDAPGMYSFRSHSLTETESTSRA